VIASEPSLTVTSLVDEILDVLHGYNRQQDQRTSLSSAITAADLGFAVQDSGALSRGVVEIDDELVYVTQVDTATGMATIAPWGRGQSSTTAATHAAGAKVTQSPLYPRQRVASAVYGLLREIFPEVFAVGQSSLDINPVRTHYAMPGDCYHVLKVEWLSPGPTGLWVPASRWRQNKPATSVELELLSAAWPGLDRGRVTYMRIPPATIAGSDDLVSYGYERQVRDLIVLGVTARMMAYTEPARVQAQSLESHGRSEAVPAGAAQTLSRYLYQLFQQRLDDERKRLALRHPPQPHFTR
jgi:hypothetical protein